MEMWEEVTEISPGIYVGGEEAARDRERLQRLGVTHVLNCASGDCENHWKNDFHYLELPLRDKTNEKIDALFYVCYHFITTALTTNGAILIHCLRGVSRSPTILISYIILRDYIPYKSAFTAVQAKRRSIQPNLGYQSRLQIWSNRLLYPELVAFPRIYQSGYIGNKACLRSVDTEKDAFLLDLRAITVIQSQERSWIWVANDTDVQLLPTAESFLNDLSQFEGASSPPILIHMSQEPGEFWQDLYPSFRPSNPYTIDPHLDRFLLPTEPENSKQGLSFFLYPDIIPYYSIKTGDVTSDMLVICYRQSQIWVFMGPEFEEDILSAGEYIDMVQSRLGGGKIVTVSAQELIEFSLINAT